ncbi:hypothetical protein CC86DRAFT_374518 [Ophiobolus disseminans]|uniref:lytic cellulose monooxygenase (C4-dehydrogenating) n=1 Tax=Ophiobolus disseminans TaxID=1469910 RepID=A0A6A6ZHY0_9PLEO|nr:hypothetical protein CC86DRAFT_374518 [Ophiobolus disseminans]
MVRALHLAALAATTSLVQGHFRFVRIAHNGVWQKPLQYIRNVTDPFYEPFNPAFDPRPNRSMTDPTYYGDAPNSVRCGRDNLNHAPTTEVLKVKAGDTLEFVNANTGYEQFEDKRFWECEDGRGYCSNFGEQSPQQYWMRIVHPGPVQMYLSAVPAGQDIGHYDGSGEWVKIKTFGVEIHKDMKKPYWLPNNGTDDGYGSGTQGLPVRMPFKIPTQTPPGSYLLRVDMVYANGDYATQLYPSCAQILVESSATGALPKGVKFPEAYEPSQPGVTVSWPQGVGIELDSNYTYPGGDLWTGEKLVVDTPDRTPI